MSNATMSVIKPKRQTFFEQHAWLVFFGMSLIVALFGLGDILTGGLTYARGEAPTFQGITGMTWDQAAAASPQTVMMIDHQVRAGGLDYIISGLFSMVVALIGFRRGDRWAWYTMWLWPLFLVLNNLTLLNALKRAAPEIPPPLISGPLFFVATVLTLVLTHRKFFLKQQEQARLPTGS